MDGRRRRDDRSYQGQGREPPRPPRWDEVPSSDPNYDPSRAPPSDRWYDEPGVPPPDPYAPQHSDPRYTFAPPPPAYAMYPPPIYANPYMYPAPYPHPVSPSYAVGGGVMVLISGSLGLLSGALFFGGGSLLWFFGGGWCFVIAIIMSIIAVIGGMMGMMRRLFPVALIGAICSLFTGGFFGISFVIGLLGLIFILIGKETFLPSAPGRNLYRY